MCYSFIIERKKEYEMRSFKEFFLEMSFDATFAKQRISSLAHVINKHLMKICLMPSSTNNSHWIDEITVWFDDIMDIFIKPNNKKLSYDTYFQLLYKNMFENIDDYTKKHHISKIKRKYPNEEIEFSLKDYDEMSQRIKNFHMEISQLISTNKYTGDEVSTLIEKHLKLSIKEIKS